MINLVTRRKLLTGIATATFAGAVPAAVRNPGFDLDRFVCDVRAANKDTDSQRAIEDVLGRALSDPKNVLDALGEPESVGLSPIYRGRDITILNIVWPPWMMLPAHNHLMWATIGIYTGREDNIIWTRGAEGKVEATGAASLSEGEVFSLPHDAIHSVTNPIPRLTAAIHIYGGDFLQLNAANGIRRH